MLFTTCEVLVAVVVVFYEGTSLKGIGEVPELLWFQVLIQFLQVDL